MSNLKSIEKLKLEKYLDMGNGYVCDFHYRTFADFFLENTGIDIWSETYNINSGSKANRMRAFWNKEPNYIVGKLLKEMIEYWKVQKLTPLSDYSAFNRSLHRECQSIILRLQSEISVDDLDAIKPNSSEEGFSLLTSSIRESIEKGEPYQALDRLHTFVVKYVRELCKRHLISFDENIPLHGLFAMYRKFLEQRGVIKSEMTDRILKSSIAMLESFNTVRNKESLAHDNLVLTQHESALIVSNISSILKFIGFMETQLFNEFKKVESEELMDENIPTEKEIEDAADAWIQLEIDKRRGK